MNYAIIGNIYKIYNNNGSAFAAKAIEEDDKFIKFQNSYGLITVVNKNSIRELVDIPKPKSPNAGGA